MTSIDEEESALKKHFFMSAYLDSARVGIEIQQLYEEVIRHLIGNVGAQVEISLKVKVEAPDGLSRSVERTVWENCHALQVKKFGFDE
jgi:hypothetical protein